MKLNKMFLYGTLKHKDGNSNYYIRGYKMYRTPFGFPVTKWTGKENDRIYGTLVEVNDFMLAHMDSMEDYIPGRDKRENMYNREEKDIYYAGKIVAGANVYIANEIAFDEDYTDNNLMKDGRW